MTTSRIERITAAVARLERRVRSQRLIQAVVSAGCWALLLGLLILTMFKTGWIDSGSAVLGLELLVLIPALAGLWAWTRQLDIIDLAQRVDRTHEFHDRLSTALYLGSRGELDAFEVAQIEDAARFVEQVNVKRAAPMPRVVDGVLLGVLALTFMGVWVLKPPSHRKPLPPAFEIKHDAVLDAATIALERERLEGIKEALAESNDPEAKALVDAIDELLTKVEDQEISDKEFLEQLDRLEQKHFDKQGRDEVEKLADALKDAAEKLEKEAKKDLKKVPEAQNLVDALKAKDMEKAAKAMEELAKLLENKDISAKELERLARLMEKFADMIDLDDPALQKLMEDNKELIEKLSELFKKDGLTQQEKQRLKKAEERQKSLKKKRDRNKQSKSRRSLQELKRRTRGMADKAKNAAKNKRKGRKQRGQKRKDAEKKEGEYRQQAGRDAKDMAKKLEEASKSQQKSKAKRMAQKQLKEMREAMQRSRKSAGDKKSESEDSKRGEDIKEFLDRAKGRKPSEGEDGRSPKDKTSPKPGDASKKNSKLEGGDGESDKKGGKAPPTPEDAKSNIAGNGEGDRTLKSETKLDSKRKDEKVNGRKGKGPTRSEVIKSASEEGFANTAYKDVYVDYESVVEEVMEKESVPAGYRFYVKRYFQLIKPQE